MTLRYEYVMLRIPGASRTVDHRCAVWTGTPAANRRCSPHHQRDPMPRSHPMHLASLAIPFLLACSEQSPVDPNVAARVSPQPSARASTLVWKTELTGTIAGNADYAI